MEKETKIVINNEYKENIITLEKDEALVLLCNNVDEFMNRIDDARVLTNDDRLEQVKVMAVNFYKEGLHLTSSTIMVNNEYKTSLIGLSIDFLENKNFTKMYEELLADHIENDVEISRVIIMDKAGLLFKFDCLLNTGSHETIVDVAIALSTKIVKFIRDTISLSKITEDNTWSYNNNEFTAFKQILSDHNVRDDLYLIFDKDDINNNRLCIIE